MQDDSPFVFVEEAEETSPTDIQVLRTPYSASYFKRLLSESGYLGHRFKLFTEFTGTRFDRVADLELSPPIAGFEPTEIGYQSVDSNLPDYIMSRIQEICESVGGDVEENKAIFIANNSWTCYSEDQTEELTLFCPMMGIEYDGTAVRKKIKFLRLNRSTGEVYPYVYHIGLGTAKNAWSHHLLGLGEEFRKGVRFSIRIGQEDVRVPYTNYTLFDSVVTKKARYTELGAQNPDDCTTVTLYLCGFLLQPDVRRYRAMFRLRRMSGYFESDLSGMPVIEMPTFIRTKMFNPMNEIHRLTVYISSPFRDEGVVIQKEEFSLYRQTKVYNEESYFVDLASDFDSIYRLLDVLGCRQPNCAVFVGFDYVTVHASILYFDTERDEYRIFDAQVQRNYPLGFLKDKITAFFMFTIRTDIPSKRELRVPEFMTLLNYHTRSFAYEGDIYPLVKRGLDQFLLSRGTFRPQYDAAEKQLVTQLLDWYTNVLTFTSLDEKGIRYGVIEERLNQFFRGTLLLLFDFQIAVRFSFDMLFAIEAGLQKALQNLYTFEGLKAVRGFVNRFLLGEEPVILRQLGMWSRYTAKDLYDFLYSRPLYASIMKEFQITYATDDIGAYLSRQRKPVLRLVREYQQVIQLARADGNSEYLIKYLSRLRDKNRFYLVRLAKQLVLDESKPLAEQIYKAFKRLFENFESQRRSMENTAKVNMAVDFAREYVMNQYDLIPEEVNEYIAAIQREQWQQYLADLARENEQKRLLGLEEEEPSPEERREILKRVMVSQVLLDKVRGHAVTSSDPDRVLKESYIRDYLSYLVEQETDRLLSTPLTEWPIGARERIEREVDRLLRVSFLTPSDNASATNTFVTLLNLVVSTRSSKYL